jgi:hypothetical protein
MSFIPKSGWLSHMATLLASTQPITAAMLRFFETDLFDSFLHKDDFPISGTPTAGDTIQWSGTAWVPVTTSASTSAVSIKPGVAANTTYISHASWIGNTDSWAVFVDSVFKGVFNSSLGLDNTTGRINIVNLEVGQSWIAFKVV